VPVDAPADAVISAEEIRYLCESADRYFVKQVVPADVVWSYAGVRSLYDDGARDARAVTRDWHLELDAGPAAKLLSVFGGKITTARALAEHALDRLGVEGRRSTAWKSLPGGDLYPAFLDWLRALSAWMPPPMVSRLSQAYGTRLKDLIGGSSSLADLGRHFGAGLYEAEVRWLTAREFARTADDILWRRTKLGLRFTPAQTKALEAFLAG
jgi:glycerol-3-phosphate dehydrogenase